MPKDKLDEEKNYEPPTSPEEKLNVDKNEMEEAEDTDPSTLKKADLKPNSNWIDRYGVKHNLSQH